MSDISKNAIAHDLAILCLQNTDSLRNVSPELLAQKYLETADKIRNYLSSQNSDKWLY